MTLLPDSPEHVEETLSALPPAGAPAGPMRVAWVTADRTMESYGRLLQPLAVGLLDELVELTALCPTRADVSALPSPPLEILRYGGYRFWGLHHHVVGSLAMELRARRVQLIHAVDADSAELARRVSLVGGLNYIVSSHEIGDAQKLGTQHEKLVGVLASSAAIVQDLLDHRVLPADRIKLLRPGVYQARHATCFSQLGNSIAIVAGGVLDDYGAFAAALRSFAELKAAGHDCAFFVLGNGPCERQLRALGDSLGLRHELTFVDRLPSWQLPDVFKAVDVFISPAPVEAVDMLSLLAMAAGVPVLGARGGAADFTIDGQTAIQFNAGRTEEITQKAAGLLADRAAARSLAERALQYLHQNHSPALAVMRLAEFYRAATAPRPTPILQTF